MSSGCGESFSVVVVSKVFEGKPLIQRHRCVWQHAQSMCQRTYVTVGVCVSVCMTVWVIAYVTGGLDTRLT